MKNKLWVITLLIMTLLTGLGLEARRGHRYRRGGIGFSFGIGRPYYYGRYNSWYRPYERVIVRESASAEYYKDIIEKKDNIIDQIENRLQDCETALKEAQNEIKNLEGK